MSGRPVTVDFQPGIMDSKYGRITTEKHDISPAEPVFLLRGQDLLAPFTLAEYSRLLRSYGKAEMAEHVGSQRQRNRLLHRLEHELMLLVSRGVHGMLARVYKRLFWNTGPIPWFDRC
jgi:hypothetical protein